MNRQEFIGRLMNRQEFIGPRMLTSPRGERNRASYLLEEVLVSRQNLSNAIGRTRNRRNREAEWSRAFHRERVHFWSKLFAEAGGDAAVSYFGLRVARKVARMRLDNDKIHGRCLCGCSEAARSEGGAS